MRLPTETLPEKSRSAVRFVIVGTLGTAIQYAFYYAFLILFEHLFQESNHWVRVAFTLGFVLETCINYLLTSYYTFQHKPNWKNLIGFIGSRGVNYLVQMLFLQLFLQLFQWHNFNEDLQAEVAGILTILLAGVVNYFLLRVMYKMLKKS